MISVEKALSLIELNVSQTPSTKVSLINSLGLVLAEDVISPIDMPPFSQSAMDGYAINFDPTIKAHMVIGEVQAGSEEVFNLFKGEAVRIFTGAAVPESTTAVVKQEDVLRAENQISFGQIEEGRNIRNKGEQIRIGDTAMRAGDRLNPAAIGFLATLGLTEVPVSPRPRISLLITGNELLGPGQDLTQGKIYESNGIMLESALSNYGFTDLTHFLVPDDYQKTLAAIRKALATSELLVLSGGISVGDYDFVGKALNEIGVEQVFYKVKQKPGKPLFFGVYEGKPVFALPGNPAAALTSFYLYILPTLNKLTLGNFVGCEQTELPISQDYDRKAERTEILKAFASDAEVEILKAQGSAMLGSFVHANALVIIPEGLKRVRKGDLVYTLLL